MDSWFHVYPRSANNSKMKINVPFYITKLVNINSKIAEYLSAKHHLPPSDTLMLRPLAKSYAKCY